MFIRSVPPNNGCCGLTLYQSAALKTAKFVVSRVYSIYPTRQKNKLLIQLHYFLISLCFFVGLIICKKRCGFCFGVILNTAHTYSIGSTCLSWTLQRKMYHPFNTSSIRANTSLGGFKNKRYNWQQ